MLIQCVNSDFCPGTVNSCDFTVHALEKKEKKYQNAEIETRKMRNPNKYLVKFRDQNNILPKKKKNLLKQT